MSPCIFDCIICGFPIFASGELNLWVSEFRVVYSNPTGVFISGVGRRINDREDQWEAPIDPKGHTDSTNADLMLYELPIMNQNPNEDWHSFVLHGSCWRLLKKQLGSKTHFLERLITIFESLVFPLRRSGACWSHDYGGYLKLDKGELRTGDLHFEYPEYGNEVWLSAEADPIDLPELSEVLTAKLGRPTAAGLQAATEDYFAMLPWEILETIAFQLPTTDAMNLRHASRTFYPLLYSGPFWASRFRIDGDRSFLFEAKELEHPDWFSLYAATKHSRLSSGLKNRKRIWDLIKSISRLLDLQDSRPTSLAIPPKMDFEPWHRVTGDVNRRALERPQNQVEEGCKVFHVHKSILPQDLSQIDVSLVELGEITFVAGMRFTSAKGASESLGYLSGNIIGHHVPTLVGFRIAVSARGIHAVQVLSKHSTPSAWIGSPDGWATTERLASFEHIEALEISFDGFKVVGIGASGRISASTANCQQLTFWQQALWHPHPPPDECLLNEASFTGQHPEITPFRPLLWDHFGGKRGCKLNHLIGVSLFGIGGMKFHYDGAFPSGILGHCNMMHEAHAKRLDIDGPGGERLQKIEVRVEKDPSPGSFDFCQHGAMMAIKISTNRGRNIHTGTILDDTGWRELCYKPGTTLTGLYAAQHLEWGMISLGIISEASC